MGPKLTCSVFLDNSIFTKLTFIILITGYDDDVLVLYPYEESKKRTYLRFTSFIVSVVGSATTFPLMLAIGYVILKLVILYLRS